MTETVNDRIITLLKTKNLDETEAAGMIGKDRSTLYRITGKVSVPSKTTVKLIADSLGADFHYLMYGQTQPKGDASNTEKTNLSKALALLEQQLAKKDEQIAQLMAIFQRVNFLKASENAYAFKMFPGMGQLASVSGANHA